MTEIEEKLAYDRRGPRKVGRLCGERRSSKMSELSRLRGSGGYGACGGESGSVPNFSGKPARGSPRYTGAVEPAGAPGHDAVRQKAEAVKRSRPK